MTSGDDRASAVGRPVSMTIDDEGMGGADADQEPTEDVAASLDCAECGGTGEIDGEACVNCGGTGKALTEYS
jgi:DnaJ-class molecular chaperone